MAFCIYCGARIPDDAKFCIHCGSPLDENIYSDSEAVSEGPVSSGTVSRGEKSEGQSVKPGIIAAAIATALVIVFALWFFLFSDICLFHRYSDATCMKPAICEKCGKTKGDPLGHDKAAMDSVEPTCTDAGITKGVVCSRCGKVFNGREEIPALGHDIVIDFGTAPTPDSDGITSGSHCDRCGAVIEKQEVWKLGEDELTFLNALDLYIGKDYSAAFEMLIARKDSSCPQISWLLGDCYYSGHGVDIDYELAYEYTCKGADAGHLPSLYSKSRLARHGYGTSKDILAADEMLAQVCSQFEDALPLLLSDYERRFLAENLYLAAYFGTGMEADPYKTFEYLEYAGKYGDGQACLYLSGLYSKSKYVETDWDKAFYWAKAASEATVVSGIEYMPYSCLATMYKYGLGCEVDEKLSDEYKAQAISLGDPRGDSYCLFYFSDSSLGGGSWYYYPN